MLSIVFVKSILTNQAWQVNTEKNSLKKFNIYKCKELLEKTDKSDIIGSKVLPDSLRRKEERVLYILHITIQNAYL